MPLRAPRGRAGRGTAPLTALFAARIVVFGIVLLDSTDVFWAASQVGHPPLHLLGAFVQVGLGIVAVGALLLVRTRVALVALAALSLLALARHELVGVELNVLVLAVAVGVAVVSRRGVPLVIAGTGLGVALIWSLGDTPSSAPVALALAALGMLVGIGLRFLLANQRAAAQWREREREVRVLARAQLADDLRAIVDSHLTETETALRSLQPGARAAELRRVLDVCAADSRAALAGLRELLVVLDVVMDDQQAPVRPALHGAPWSHRISLLLRSSNARIVGSAVAVLFSVRQGIGAGNDPLTAVVDAAVWGAVGLALWWPGVGAVLAAAAVVLAAAPTQISAVAVLGVGVLWLLAGLTRRASVAGLAAVATTAAVVAALVHPGSATVGLVVTVGTASAGVLLGLWLAEFFGAVDDAVGRRWRVAQGPAQLHAQERRWVGREMHDIVGHELSRVALHALAVDGVDDEAQLSEALEGIATTVASTRQALASLLAALADAVPGAAPAGPLVPPSAAVATMADVLQSAGHPASVGHDPAADRADEAVQRTVHRVLLEATTNMLRHTPAGAQCEVSVRLWGETVVVRCANPVGSAKLDHSLGRGLRGMQERAAWLGGVVHSGTDDGGRTWVLHVELPAHAEVSEPSDRVGVSAQAQCRHECSVDFPHLPLQRQR